MAADPSITLAEMRAHARLLLQDNDPGGAYGLTDSRLNELINEAYIDYMAETDQSVVDVATIDLDGAGDYAPTLTDDARTVRRWLRAKLDDPSYLVSPGVGGVVLERLEPNELRTLRSAGATAVASSGDPRYWSLEQVGGYGPESWTVSVYPDQSPVTVTLYGELHPAKLQLDADVPNLPATEARWVARMAAVRGAVLLNRSPAFVAALAADLPKNIAIATNISDQYMNPRKRVDEEPI